MARRQPRGLDNYRAQVLPAEMQRRYGLAWLDACGDDEPLVRARSAGRSPAEFVAWWGEKYDLIEQIRFLVGALPGT